VCKSTTLMRRDNGMLKGNMNSAIVLCVCVRARARDFFISLCLASHHVVVSYFADIL
jgi:hypothetical protein